MQILAANAAAPEARSRGVQWARTMAHTLRVLTAGCNGALPPLALMIGILLMMYAMSRCKHILTRGLFTLLLIMLALPPHLAFSGDAGTPLLPQDDVSFLMYYHADHLGSSHLITEGNASGALHAGITYPRGTVLQRFEYGAWGGERFALNPNLSLDPRFTGQEYDLDTGLYFFKTRYYNPVLARFLQPDTVVPNLADPQAYNRYSYVRNNPLKYIDPTGHHYTEADDRMLNGDASDQTADEHFAAMHDPGYSANPAESMPDGLIAETTNADQNNNNVETPTEAEAYESKIEDSLPGAMVGVGREIGKTGALRGEYASRAGGLAVDDILGREALKSEFRSRQTALGKAITETILKERALSNETAAFRNAASTNLSVNTAGSVMKYGGRALALAGVGMEVYNVATAPEGQKIQASTEAVGRLGGGAAGGWVGAQLGIAGGPWGAGIGAIVGGIAGAIGGESAVNAIFDW